MPIVAYPPDVETAMQILYDSLCERERRRYAAVEATKLGHGGLLYVAQLFRCSERTIRRGLAELQQPPTLPAGRSRKKGADANAV